MERLRRGVKGGPYQLYVAIIATGSHSSCGPIRLLVFTRAIMSFSISHRMYLKRASRLVTNYDDAPLRKGGFPSNILQFELC
jgi:hypothetical protein